MVGHIGGAFKIFLLFMPTECCSVGRENRCSTPLYIIQSPSCRLRVVRERIINLTQYRSLVENTGAKKGDSGNIYHLGWHMLKNENHAYRGRRLKHLRQAITYLRISFPSKHG